MLLARYLIFFVKCIFMDKLALRDKTDVISVSKQDVYQVETAVED